MSFVPATLLFLGGGLLFVVGVSSFVGGGLVVDLFAGGARHSWVGG